MKKFNVLLFGISILGLSFYGLLTNSHYVQILINVSVFFIYVRIVLVAALLAYVFVPSIRLYTTKALISVGGILMLSLGLISLGSPSLLGHTNTYILFGDSLILIEAGILAIVLSAELSAQRSQFMVKIFDHIQSQFTDSLKRVVYTQMPYSTVQNMTLAQYSYNNNAKVPIVKQLIKGFALPSKALP